MNRRAAIAAGVCAIIAAGMLFGGTLLFFVAIALGLVVATSYLMSAAWNDSAIIVRSFGSATGPTRIPPLKIGSRVPVRISVTNRSRIPMAWLLVEDQPPRFTTDGDDVTTPPIEIDGPRVAVMMLRSGQTKTIDYTVHCRRRGYIRLGPTLMETGDLLGLFRRYRVIESIAHLTVLPAVRTLEGYDIGSRRPIGEIRLRERSMEDPTRLRGIRDWRVGDPMRSIHWAATARTGQLHTKIYEPSSIIGATIILDLHVGSNPPSGEPVRGDLAITAAASIAYHLQQSGEPFGLCTNARDAADRLRREDRERRSRTFGRRGEASRAGSRIEDNDRLRPVVMPPDRTPIHLTSMLTMLARLERSDGLTLPELLIETESQLSAETTMLIVVQQADENALAAIIGYKRRGRAVEVILNTADEESFSRIAGPLIAARIDVHPLRGVDDISALCQQTLVR